MGIHELSEKLLVLIIMKTKASDPKPAGQELDAQLTATGPWGSSRLGRL